MISPDLANTILLLQKGRALVEVAAIRPENNIRINVTGASAQLLKPGLKDIDADYSQIRVVATEKRWCKPTEAKWR